MQRNGHEIYSAVKRFPTIPASSNIVACDLPLLKAVKHPVTVNADATLAGATASCIESGSGHHKSVNGQPGWRTPRIMNVFPD